MGNEKCCFAISRRRNYAHFTISDGNGFADPGELQAVYKEDARPAAVPAEEGKVHTLPIYLQSGLDPEPIPDPDTDPES